MANCYKLQPDVQIESIINYDPIHDNIANWIHCLLSQSTMEEEKGKRMKLQSGF